MSNSINFVNSDTLDLTVETKRIIKNIKDEIANVGMVSSGTIVTLESYMGDNVIPFNIKNGVTSTPSKHGAKPLLELLASICNDTSEVNIKEVLTEAIYASNQINVSVINRAEEVIMNDLALLDKLYIPNKLRSDDADVVMSDIKVGMYISNMDMIKAYSEIDSYTLKYLVRRESTSVPFGVFNAIMLLINQTSTISNISKHYSGSIKDFMLDQLAAYKEYVEIYNKLSDIYNSVNPVKHLLRDILIDTDKEYILNAIDRRYTGISLKTMLDVLTRDEYIISIRASSCKK